MRRTVIGSVGGGRNSGAVQIQAQRSGLTKMRSGRKDPDEPDNFESPMLVDFFVRQPDLRNRERRRASRQDGVVSDIDRDSDGPPIPDWGERRDAGCYCGRVRIPRAGTDRLTAVVIVNSSGGVMASEDAWSRELNGLGIATFILDGFTGRGITSTAADQAQLGRFTMINDACGQNGREMDRSRFTVRRRVHD